MADAGTAAVADGPVAEHFSRNYAGRLRENARANGGPPDMAEALDVFDAISNGYPDNQMVAAGLPPTMAGPDGQQALIPPLPEPQQAFFTQGVQDMAAPTLLTGGTFMQVTFIFNAERHGWSETLHAQVTAGDPYTKLHQAAKDYVGERIKFLHRDCKLEAIRFSKVGVRGDSDLKRGGGFNLGRGKLPVAKTPEKIEIAWQYRLEDASGLVHANPVYRGLCQEDAPSLVTGSPMPESIPDRINAWTSFLTSLYANGQNGVATYPDVKFCMKTYDGDREDTAGAKVINFREDSQKLIVFDLADAGAPGFVVGDTVKLRVPRLKCATGVSGEAVVSSISTTGAGVVSVTIRKRTCCNVAGLAGVVGRVLKKTKGYVGVDEVAPVALGKRDTGSAFFRRRGRQKERCC